MDDSAVEAAGLPAGHDFPTLWLMRHGETEWSRSGQYTGLTDLELTPAGEQQAVAAGRKLAGISFDTVLTSPLRRARRSAELAGFPGAEVVPFAHEWDYGDYEGISSAAIRAKDPSYLIWTHGVPGGETIAQVAGRADRVIARVLEGSSGPRPAAPEGAAAAPPDPSVPGSAPAPQQRNVLLVAHGHFLRILAARWLRLEPVEGRHFVLGTAAVCSLGWDKRTPAITGWNV
ncbi:histidine phosphatase family protein [Arthrobacter sp. I2-34]|uniref:Histidine phosphatase family protein n=1 Tax=Arthrobacter hankyongi TaxID=2904801 RepID=A0ABS9LAE3_9MICC|nr:histidine phosphatase family protein [Arthrobacter hankyongi]MCG2623656.1 histidine phosphatase family protein [Arthrobacter hankyongi]